VVATYNRAEMLRCALESLIYQKTDGIFSYEIVIIDDGSTDDTSNVVMEIAAISQVPVRYVRKEGEDVASARNKGVAVSRGKWIAFFDDDQWAESDWLKKLLAIALQTDAGCVGGSIRLDLPKEQISRLGCVCRGVLGEKSYHGKPVRCQGKFLPSSGNLLIARRIFVSIGLFCNSMLYGGEDSDFVARAQRAGFDIWIAPDAVVHHMIRPYRLKRAYFRLVSLRWGIQFAQMDFSHLGRGKMLLLCIARICQALVVNVPCLLLAYLRRDKAAALDRKCLLWRAAGYARQSLFFSGPKIFSQRRFFEVLDFRKGRSV